MSSSDGGDVSLMIHEAPAPRFAAELLADAFGGVCGNGGGVGGSGVDADGSGGGGDGGDGADGGDLGGVHPDGVPEQASGSKLPVVPGHTLYPSLCLVCPVAREVVEDEGVDDLKEVVKKESRPTTRSGRVRLSPPARRCRSARPSVLER